jgi:hypothetical protein
VIFIKNDKLEFASRFSSVKSTLGFGSNLLSGF